MVHTLLNEIAKELRRLSDYRYREKENVFLEVKGLRLLKKLFGEARSLRRQTVLNFCRQVADCASPDSRISQLTNRLYAASIPDRGEEKESG